MSVENLGAQFDQNEKLCNAVKCHPCIYDSFSKVFRVKIDMDTAWQSIAVECSDDEVSCQERWRFIRKCYLLAANKCWNFYLNKSLQFLNPHLSALKAIDAEEYILYGSIAKEYEDLVNILVYPPPTSESADEAKSEPIRILCSQAIQAIVQNPQHAKPSANRKPTEGETTLPVRRSTRLSKSIKSYTEDKNFGNDAVEPKRRLPRYDANVNFSLYSKYPMVVVGNPKTLESKLTQTARLPGPTRTDSCIQTDGMPEPQKSDNFTLTDGPETEKESLQSELNVAETNAIKFAPTLVPQIVIMNLRQRFLFKYFVWQALWKVFHEPCDFKIDDFKQLFPKALYLDDYTTDEYLAMCNFINDVYSFRNPTKIRDYQHISKADRHGGMSQQNAVVAMESSHEEENEMQTIVADKLPYPEMSHVDAEECPNVVDAIVTKDVVLQQEPSVAMEMSVQTELTSEANELFALDYDLPAVTAELAETL